MRGYIVSDMVQVFPPTVPTWALLVSGDEVQPLPVIAWALCEERLADEAHAVVRNVRALILGEDDSLIPAGIPQNFAGLTTSLDDLPTVDEAREWIAELGA